MSERGLEAAGNSVHPTRIVHRVATGAASLFVEVIGQGEPVVFLHAAVGDRRMWSRQCDGIGLGHMGIAYDRRGFGNTSAQREDHSAVGDLLAMLDAIAPGRVAILVGCSQGGGIAINAALLHPSRVRALVLVAPSVAGAPEASVSLKTRSEFARLEEAEKAGDLERVGAIKAHLWLDGPLATEGRVDGDARRLFLEMNAMALQSPPPGQSVDAVQAYERLSEITVPTLVLWGDLDFEHIQKRCGHIVASVAHGSGHMIPGTAHLPSLEQPERVTQLIDRFLTRLEPA